MAQRRRLRLLLSVFGALALGSVGAHAQPAAAQNSVEEAVSYLVSGVTDGSTVGTSVFKRTSASPAAYSTSRAKPTDHEPLVTITTTKKSACVFELTLAMDQGHGPTKRVATLDFSKVRAMDYLGRERVKVTGNDFCKGDIAPACSGQLATDVLPDKYKQAYAELRRSCP